MAYGVCYNLLFQSLLLLLGSQEDISESLASDLKTNLDNGINGDDEEDILRRHKAFGSNTYQKPPTKRFYHFLWEALKDPTIIILLACGALSLGFGIKENGLKEGWYDGGIIFLAVFLVIVVSAGKMEGGQVLIFEIVVGDVVCLKIGDQVPTDGLFIAGHSPQVDESNMTGESEHLQVNLNRNLFLFLGTKLNKLTSAISKVGLVLMVLLVRYFTGNTNDANGNTEFNGSKTKVDDIINSVVGIVAAIVTIVVVAIHEGLPLAVTLTLTYSMKRMMADYAMVRKLSACETMASATVICTDKTGTLTLNQIKPHQKSNSFLGCHGTKHGYGETEAELFNPHVEAFNSTKESSRVSMRKKDDNTINVHWKEAAEMVLAMCSYYYDVSGEIKVLDDVEKKKFDQMIQGMASSGLRCIAFAHKQVQEEETEGEKVNTNLKDGNLTLLGLVGIKDPCRPGVQKAMEACQYTRVNIKMITGDNVFTTKAIATECGILRPYQDISGVVVEGEEFRNYTLDERLEKVDKICVMERSSPFDNFLMVQCLKQKGYVLVVTGDGTDDAPVLKEADIVLSMGIQGREVAKESSDIVILDDNFGSIVMVLKWGRCVYDNIKKFIQFQLTVNVAALFINFVAAVSVGEVPLTAVQLLWANFIMDTLAALALATKKPFKELTQKPPVGRTKPLITNIMWRNVLAQAFYQIAVLLTFSRRRMSPRKYIGESCFSRSLGLPFSSSVDSGVPEEICKYREVELVAVGSMYLICCSIFADWLACEVDTCSKETI
ncbi:putative calcium-transporting ATPase 13, plasma membrane-type [Camellia lanceoleosa]|uniref:Calcium-transporting ATPase 13, plasma membrane-type n=1 Tax=Camellia lanceoleosa TaxID=1840588 RepID=A0ACC0HDJ4_9ERIC|nr:putative calcium-transporting ATPase 13, plasma membrane-type [Camellia lanceoleosa]